MGFKICILAGEESGDLHAFNLVRKLKEIFNNEVFFFGMGGDNLKLCGVRIDLETKDVSVVGISEVFSKIFSIYKSYKHLCNVILKEKPDAIIAVDFPDFNFKVVKFAKKLNIKVIYYITPQVWAWRRKRVHFLKKYVDLCLNILPFEEDFFKNYGINAFYVGHPILDIEREVRTREEFLSKLNIKDKKIVAILPGSRNSEIKSHLKTLVKTALRINEKRDDVVFVIPKAKNVLLKLFDLPKPKNFFIVENLYYETLSYSDVALSASGTASLECALSALPTIVFYKLNQFSYHLGKILVKLPFISLPNIILNREGLKEFIQKDFEEGRLSEEVLKMLQNLDYHKDNAIRLKQELTLILGKRGASERAAFKIREILSK